MAWWGKLVGGALGFMVGGPLGALIGASFGHQIDAGSGSLQLGAQERTQAAFFTATFSILGHIAKADGEVSREEISLVEQLMDHMQLNLEQRKAAIFLFNRGKEPDFPFADVITQFGRECHRRTTLVQMFLEIQIQAALADGTLHSGESAILGKIAQSLDIPSAALERLIDMARGAAAAHAGTQQLSLDDAYRVIGVEADTSSADIRKAYRRLMSQHHPDKLVSKGLPEEMIKLANERTAEISAAWDRIQQAHKN